MKKLLTTLLAVCLVFTNAGFFNKMLSYAETEYITKAEFYSVNAQEEVILSTNPEHVQLCSYTDLDFSPFLKLYAGPSLEGYRVRVSHWDSTSKQFKPIQPQWPFQNKGPQKFQTYLRAHLL